MQLESVMGKFHSNNKKAANKMLDALNAHIVRNKNNNHNEKKKKPKNVDH